MIAILSPAKNMRAISLPYEISLTEPQFPQKTQQILRELKQYQPWQLEEKMKINSQIALSAFFYFQDFSWDSLRYPALLSYYGLAYQNLDAHNFSMVDLQFAQDHLRILSAFYGVLRPLDRIAPYRLEMQCKIKVGGKSLYRFWADDWYRTLFCTGEPVINLASAEYFKAITPFLQERDRFITCEFLVQRHGKWKMLPTFAKMARGQMAKFLIQQRLNEPEELKKFCWDGYEYEKTYSSNSKYIFVKQ